MQQAARTARGARHWTGRMLPVLCVALLAIGTGYAKEQGKKSAGEDAPARVEPLRNIASSKSSNASKKEDAPRREDPPRRENTPKPEPKGISMDRAVKQIQDKYKARVVRTDERRKGGRVVYELKVLSDERLWTVRVDAETGRELD